MKNEFLDRWGWVFIAALALVLATMFATKTLPQMMHDAAIYEGRMQ